MSYFHQKPNVYVSEVHLNVLNLERTLEFYQTIVGLRVLEKFERKAILTADGITPLVTIEQPVNVMPKARRTTGLYHFALLLPSRKELGKLIKHFIDTQYPLQGASNHRISEALYFADPDGNGIEIYADTPPSTWLWKDGEIEGVSEPMDVKSVIAEAGDDQWDGIPANTIIGHLHLHASELQNIRKFYQEGIGYDIVVNIPNQAMFFSTGKYHHHIGLNVWNGIGALKPAENSVGIVFYTLLFPSAEARYEAIQRLENLGYDVTEENGCFITEDPSKNKLKMVI